MFRVERWRVVGLVIVRRRRLELGKVWVVKLGAEGHCRVGVGDGGCHWGRRGVYLCVCVCVCGLGCGWGSGWVHVQGGELIWGLGIGLGWGDKGVRVG